MKREKFQPTPQYRKFISALRLARQEKGVSQRELARRLGDAHWSKIIRSENCERPMDIIEVRAWCEALEISVVEFTKQLDECLNAMETPDSANVDAPTSPDDASSMTPPSSLL